MTSHNEDHLDRLIAALPRQTQPARDLWPGIRARLGGRDTARDFGRRFLALALAAGFAGAIAVSISVWFGAREMPAGRDNPVLLQAAALDSEFRPMRSELRAALLADDTNINPETRRVVLNNLKQIDEAVANIHDALRRDPTAARLVPMLAGVYLEELTVLKQIRSIATSNSMPTPAGASQRSTL